MMLEDFVDLTPSMMGLLSILPGTQLTEYMNQRIPLELRPYMPKVFLTGAAGLNNVVVFYNLNADGEENLPLLLWNVLSCP